MARCILKKKTVFYFIVCASCLCLLCGWTGHLGTVSDKGPVACASSNRTPVTVLLWHWPFGKASPLDGDVCWNLYNIPGCKVVDQRSEFSNADVVVFHQRELASKKQKLPLHLPRPSRQRWAWMSLEAPQYNGDLRPFAHVFNLTVSYRRDADVTIPYGLLRKQDGRAPDVSTDKTHLACWVVSNFNGRHNRSRVYRELSALVEVAVFGGWRNARLPGAKLLPTISRCYFYLAFENSIAKDYITEKLWRNAYLGGAVPVVLGPPPDDYKAVAPPGSFIHVGDFASVGELGAHLRALAADEQRYREFFRWRREWRVKLITDWRERLCQICTRYHCLPQRKVYADLQGWSDAK